MSKNAQVVDGEASESDSEIEIGKSPDLDLTVNTKSFVIAGEAPESDDETKLTIPPNPPELDPPLHSVLRPTLSPAPATSNIYNSLLHQKLWECNVSFRATLEGLIKHTTEISVEKLTRADKTLLNVQESMRATNANLTLARARLKQLHAELDKANCSTALPTVKIK
uniref:Biogenesis of lysosome-related organelles complex 1 subunit 3 n=1 Tax=Spodoptera frugiperda TaxID=7108 RepID=A0A2H1VTS2_SPOFR